MSTQPAGYRIEQEAGLATLVFDRPEVGNAISPEMVGGLTAFFVAARASAEVGCILVRGEGRHFSAGGDVAGFARLIEEDPAALPELVAEKLDKAGALVEAILAFDRPIVASVRGAAAGAGLMFALAADIVIVDPTALFLFSHQLIGLSPDGGVSWLLPRVVGARTASRLVLTAAKVGAAEAVALGLASQQVEAEALDAEAAKIARRLSRAPRTAMRTAKRLLARSETSSVSDQLRAERDGVVACVSDADFTEGVRAFTGKRPARFPSAHPPEGPSGE